MEQRSLRLGDIVDDYCPRERRVTNHVIVALVGNAIRQTRCSTCDAEHEYKEAKVPKKKGKAGSAELNDLAGGVLVTPKPAPMNGEAQDVTVEAAPEGNGAAGPEPEPEPVGAAGQVDNEASPAGQDGAPDSWFSHRPLIRASLPRTDSDPPPPRTIPEFTMHQRHGRGFGGRGFRHHQPAGNGSFRNNNNNNNNDFSGNEPDGNRAPQPGRPGRRRRRRRR